MHLEEFKQGKEHVDLDIASNNYKFNILVSFRSYCHLTTSKTATIV